MLFNGCHVELGGTKTGTSIIDDKTFVDDMGNLIKIEGAYTNIISLYPDHTENLFSLGVGETIIGVNQKSLFPPSVSELPKYSFEKEFDIEAMINAKPDLVLVAPTINKEHASFVTKLETAGLNVVSLMPENPDEFDIYIQKLAMLTGKQDDYQAILQQFYTELEEIKALTSSVEPNQNIFIETSENGYYTVAPNSLIDQAIDYASGNNIAKEVKRQYENVPIAPFGLKSILANKEKIDVYVSLTGISNPGSSLISIHQKSEFDEVKAIKDGRVYEMDNVIIGAYTFRYLVGVNELARYLYPQQIDNYEPLRTDEPLTRGTFAEILVKFFHLPVSTISSSTYYDYEKYNHSYGKFTDVDWQDEDFYYIETAVMHSFLKPIKKEDGSEVFDRNALVTRSDIASFMYILNDIESMDINVKIDDIDNEENKDIIQKVVDNGLMDIEGGNFKPNGTYTNEEIINFLETIEIERNPD